MTSRRTIARRFGLLGLLAAGLALVGAVGSPAARAWQTPLPATPAPEAAHAQHGGTSASFDQAFIDMMVPHHEGAVAMALIARERSSRSEIQALAAEIARSQDAEIARLRAWRLEWFGSAATPSMSEMPMLHDEPPGTTMAHDMAAEVELLRTAPEPFDRAFIDLMIPHHASAIEAARLALQRAERDEIRALAGEIIAAQQREIDQMQTWRHTWFGPPLAAPTAVPSPAVTPPTPGQTVAPGGAAPAPGGGAAPTVTATPRAVPSPPPNTHRH